MADIIDTEEIDKDTVTPDILAQQFSQKYKLITETAVSLKKSYINKLHGTKSFKLAVSQSDNSIEVYELNNTSLSRVCRLSGHQNALTEVVFSPNEDYLLYSSGQDGLVKLWDTRTSGSCVQEYKNEEESPELIKLYDCMDVSCNARVLCAGSQLLQDDAYLVFWDQRMPAPLGGYWNSHTDDISQVKFHPTKSEILASGSLDGLLNIYNILEPNEDDALTYSLNVENSVEKISWLQGDSIAMVSQSSDVQLWDAGNGDSVRSYGRDKVARSCKRSKEDDCYVVDVFVSADDAVTVLAGSNGGDGSVLRSLCAEERRLRARTVFAANEQVVRCCWYHAQHDVLVTAGEGGLVSVWARGEGGDTSARARDRQGHKMLAKRHKPY